MNLDDQDDVQIAITLKIQCIPIRVDCKYNQALHKLTLSDTRGNFDDDLNVFGDYLICYLFRKNTRKVKYENVCPFMKNEIGNCVNSFGGHGDNFPAYPHSSLIFANRLYLLTSSQLLKIWIIHRFFCFHSFLVTSGHGKIISLRVIAFKLLFIPFAKKNVQISIALYNLSTRKLEKYWLLSLNLELFVR